MASTIETTLNLKLRSEVGAMMNNVMEAIGRKPK
jgi:hypothetical protein